MAVVEAGFGEDHVAGDAADVVAEIGALGEVVDDEVEALAAHGGVGIGGVAVAHEAGLVGVFVDATKSDVAVEGVDFHAAIFRQFPGEHGHEGGDGHDAVAFAGGAVAITAEEEIFCLWLAAVHGVFVERGIEHLRFVEAFAVFLDGRDHAFVAGLEKVFGEENRLIGRIPSPLRFARWFIPIHGKCFRFFGFAACEQGKAEQAFFVNDAAAFFRMLEQVVDGAGGEFFRLGAVFREGIAEATDGFQRHGDCGCFATADDIESQGAVLAFAVFDRIAEVHDGPLVAVAGFHPVAFIEGVLCEGLAIGGGNFIVDEQFSRSGRAGENVFHDEGCLLENRPSPRGAEVHEEAGAFLVRADLRRFIPLTEIVGIGDGMGHSRDGKG